MSAQSLSHEHSSRGQIRRADHRTLSARRWTVLVTVSIIALTSCQPLSQEVSRPADHSEVRLEHPNILLVTLCSFRHNRIGAAWQYPRDLTPYLDSLAGRGVFFENAVSSACWTKPSTASLLTGTTPGVHRMSDYYKVADILAGKVTPKRKMPNGVVTLAELLTNAGYRTASRVNNVHAGEYFDVTRGFQDRRTDNKVDTHALLDDFERWLEASDGSKPFFFLLFTLDLHTPYNPGFEWYSAHSRRTPKVPKDDYSRFRMSVYRDVMAILKDNEPCWPEPLRRDWIDLYDAAVARLDAALSRIPAILTEAGVLGDTVVILTADHGERFFEHGRVDHGWFPDEPVLHVPLILAGPGIPQGLRVPEVVRSIDLYPTVAAIAGLEPPSTIQGVNLLPFLEAPERGFPKLGALSYGSGQTLALRRGAHKLFFDGASGDSRLYNIERDFLQEFDLAEVSPELTQRLLDELHELLDREAALQALVGEGEEVELDDKIIEELRALGYLRE